MQGSWGAKSIFTEMAKQYVERVEKMSGGRLKIDYLPAGAVVKAFQVQDACNKGVLDGAHTVTAYWYGKNKAASLFGTGPVFGANASQILAWIHFGGGKEMYRELLQDILKLNLVGFFTMPMPTPAARLVQEEDQLRRGPPGPEVPHRGPRHRHHAGHGPQGDPASGRGDHAGPSNAG